MDWGDIPLIRPEHGKVAFEFRVLAKCGDTMSIGVSAPPVDVNSFLGAASSSWGFQPPESFHDGNSEFVRERARAAPWQFTTAFFCACGGG